MRARRNIRLQIRTAAGRLQAYSAPMRYVLALLAALTLIPAHAQRIQSQAELDALLAPIALQPDGVLSQVLLAATRPEEVAAAASWSRANPQLSGDAAVRAAESQPWDPSVKALVAFPELLARMGESPQWVRDLGEAFVAQEPQVMDTVQGLRKRAQANGHLASNNYQTVYQQDDAIVVYPRTQIVYVHHYDPYLVYGPWWWPHYRPVYWHPWAPRAVFVAHFHSRADWQRRHVHHHHHHQHHGRWQHHGDHRPVKRPLNAQPRPYHRVPESQRQPIVQSMPAANAFSQQRRDVPPRQVNTIKHTPSIQHTPPAANAFSQQRRDVPRVQQQQGAQFRPNTIKHNPGGGNQQGQRR